MTFIQNGKFYSTPVHVLYNITNGYWNEPGFILYRIYHLSYCSSGKVLDHVDVCVCVFLGGGGGFIGYTSNCSDPCIICCQRQYKMTTYQMNF